MARSPGARHPEFEVAAQDPRALAGPGESGVQRFEHLDLDQSSRATRRQARDMNLELRAGAATVPAT
jgi:hypothetical protein